MENPRELVMAWARVRRRVIPAAPIGCPCGCMTKRPWMLDPDCMLERWPVRDDPVCPACLTVLDPGGTCFTCSAPLPPPVPVFTGRCYACGKPGHMRAHCTEGKR